MKNEEAVDLMKNLMHNLEAYYGLSKQGRTAFRMAITALEERKRGKWIQRSDTPRYYYCSNCHRVISVTSADQMEKFHAFCGTCGADMRGEQDD